MKESISAYVEDKPEIFFLEGIFKETIWGGERLRKEYAYQIPSDTTGEYWAVSAHENGDSSVVGGAYQGLSLSSLWKNHRELFGNLEGDRFPLLVKIIDAKQDLSIQVHPDDSYAKIHENGSFGKTECWYILDCDENASIVIGHNARTKEELTDMIHQGRWTELIREIPIRKGDFFQINPGTVHAIKGGTMILETQQNSDITYRVYDYDRMTDGKKRELHIEKSIDVIDTPNIVETKTLTSTEDSTQVLISCSYYTVEKRDITECESFNQDKAFQIFSVIEGEGMINDTPIRKGDHFLLPYKFGAYTLSGNMSLICSYL
ncbi:MAG TPA: mannose-6-phosphate isomerase, class I [Lachnospiraceae bacterium]|nr:mannose-6-phosphate isomerase, class I [Lachnospiraceae bacterium]